MNTENSTSESSASGRHYNDSAIHQHALQCSNQVKGGKFTRVGQDFIDEVHADVDSLLRRIKNVDWPVQIHEPVDAGELNFVTGALMDRFQEAVNLAIARLIQRKVQKQPSCGKTLGRTY